MKGACSFIISVSFNICTSAGGEEQTSEEEDSIDAWTAAAPKRQETEKFNAIHEPNMPLRVTRVDPELGPILG